MSCIATAAWSSPWRCSTCPRAFPSAWPWTPCPPSCARMARHCRRWPSCPWWGCPGWSSSSGRPGSTTIGRAVSAGGVAGSCRCNASSSPACSAWRRSASAWPVPVGRSPAGAGFAGQRDPGHRHRRHGGGALQRRAAGQGQRGTDRRGDDRLLRRRRRQPDPRRAFRPAHGVPGHGLRAAGKPVLRARPGARRPPRTPRHRPPRPACCASCVGRWRLRCWHWHCCRR